MVLVLVASQPNLRSLVEDPVSEQAEAVAQLRVPNLQKRSSCVQSIVFFKFFSILQFFFIF